MGQLARFSGAYINCTYTVDAMTAPAGGGFLFDTNALHSAAEFPKNNITRTAIILEFHPHDKVNSIKKHGFKNPCPSASREDWD
jgi:hypothetical protein